MDELEPWKRGCQARTIAHRNTARPLDGTCVCVCPHVQISRSLISPTLGLLLFAHLRQTSMEVQEKGSPGMGC
jgi:hypothetical protein